LEKGAAAPKALAALQHSEAVIFFFCNDSLRWVAAGVGGGFSP
jgi:hypothetical protein